MKTALILFFAILMTSSFTWAQNKQPGGPRGGDGEGRKLMVGLSYQQTFFNPADINIAAGQSGTIPKFPGLTSGTGYGGFVGYRFLPHWDFRLSYETFVSKNPVGTNSPTGTDGGFSINQSTIFGELNYYVTRNFYPNAGNFIYVGAHYGMVLSSGVTRRVGTTITDWETETTSPIGAQVGGGFLISSNFAFLGNLRYSFQKNPRAKLPNGQELQQHSTGAFRRAGVDLSGLTASISAVLML